MDRDNKLILEALNSKFTKPVDVSDSIKTQLGQAHGIIKGLIELLDRTPSGQTPYNEMAITHLVNLQEDLKELSQILQDRMLNKSENAEASTQKLNFPEEIANKLPEGLTPGEVLMKCMEVGEELLTPTYGHKAKQTLYKMRWYDEDFADDVLRAYAHFHGFRKEENAENAEGAAKTPYNAMMHLTQAANEIRDILKSHADDEAQVEHIIRMAQIILGPKSDHTDAEYRKMLDGLIVILNRFIIVPMN